MLCKILAQFLFLCLETEIPEKWKECENCGTTICNNDNFSEHVKTKHEAIAANLMMSLALFLAILLLASFPPPATPSCLTLQSFLSGLRVSLSRLPPSSRSDLSWKGGRGQHEGWRSRTRGRFRAELWRVSPRQPCSLLPWRRWRNQGYFSFLLWLQGIKMKIWKNMDDNQNDSHVLAQNISSQVPGLKTGVRALVCLFPGAGLPPTLLV